MDDLDESQACVCSVLNFPRSAGVNRTVESISGGHTAGPSGYDGATMLTRYARYTLISCYKKLKNIHGRYEPISRGGSISIGFYSFSCCFPVP